jgi:hypothetical protein
MRYWLFPYWKEHVKFYSETRDTSSEKGSEMLKWSANGDFYVLRLSPANGDFYVLRLSPANGEFYGFRLSPANGDFYALRLPQTTYTRYVRWNSSVSLGISNWNANNGHAGVVLSMVLFSFVTLCALVGGYHGPCSLKCWYRYPPAGHTASQL